MRIINDIFIIILSRLCPWPFILSLALPVNVVFETMLTIHLLPITGPSAIASFLNCPCFHNAHLWLWIYSLSNYWFDLCADCLLNCDYNFAWTMYCLSIKAKWILTPWTPFPYLSYLHNIHLKKNLHSRISSTYVYPTKKGNTSL